jgi:hypothetical protein
LALPKVDQLLPKPIDVTDGGTPLRARPPNPIEVTDGATPFT